MSTVFDLNEGVPGGIRRPSKRVWKGFPGINNMYQKKICINSRMARWHMRTW